MYARRKVFSLGDGNIYQKLYSEAFEDGVSYAIQRMFADDYDPGMDFDGETYKEQYDGKGGSKSEGKGTGESTKKDNIFKRGWNKFKEDIWETGKGLRDGEGDAKKLNWKRLGKRAGVIGGGTALVAVPTALAIRHHNKKKAAEAEN